MDRKKGRRLNTMVGGELDGKKKYKMRDGWTDGGVS